MSTDLPRHLQAVELRDAYHAHKAAERQYQMLARLARLSDPKEAPLRNPELQEALKDVEVAGENYQKVESGVDESVLQAFYRDIGR